MAGSPSLPFPRPVGRRIAYPRPLRPGDIIGITAPSAGVPHAVEPRLQFCLEKLTALGYRYRLGNCLLSDQMVSAPAAARAAELMHMLLDDSLAAIMPPWGGELLVDILPLLDFKTLARSRNPKWIIGYSDLSTFMLPYTLLTRIATLHGSNLLECPIQPTDTNLAYWNQVATLPAGSSFVQHAASLYQKTDVDWAKHPEATAFDRTEPVAWKTLGHEDDPAYGTVFSGRLLGGTLDVIGTLTGTSYGPVEAFGRRYARTGLIVYFDNCDFNTAQYCRMLHQIRNAEWLKRANGVLVGRTAGEQLREFTVRDALLDALGDLSIPVIYDVDLGHLPPQLILVNGAFATVRFSAAAPSVEQILA
jgi:muramoyltetrapeptide carboxypeptidase LdcA involved in peptidoglycan recycling